MIRRAAFVVMLLTANGAYASGQLDRMEELSEQLSKYMYEAMVESAATEGADVSNLKTMIPDTSWDGPMRNAAECVLDKYEDKIGQKGIDKMLEEIEDLVKQLKEGGGMQAFEAASSDMQPEGISEEESIAINEECGMADEMQRQMMEDGFVTELMKLMAAGQ